MFGQVVIGAPGAGKTVYCTGMGDFLTALGRKVAIVNLDPANDFLPYTPKVNISNLITLNDVMDEYKLGPNGGLMYCMEYLEKNIDWLFEELEKHQDHYLLFDCPGQVELYTHHESMRNIVDQLQKKGYRLCAIHLVDSYYCSSASNYISAVLLSLSTMLQLELPHINVLSKIDLIERLGKLDFNLEFYINANSLEQLEWSMEKERFSAKHKKLSSLICEAVEDFDLVTFSTLNINDKISVATLSKLIDKSNGYCFGALDGEQSIVGSIMVADMDFEYYKAAAVQEKYMEPGDYEDLKPT